MTRKPPVAPRPEQIRRPSGGFGWLEDRLLHHGWLSDLGPDATAVLVLLALAADRRGASFYGRGRMASLLGLDIHRVDNALQKLTDFRLVTMRPWKQGSKDGVWQLLPIPSSQHTRDGGSMEIGQILTRLGMDANR